MAGVGAWGPTAIGGRGRRWPRFLLAALLSAGVAAVSATASVATYTVNAVTQNVEVVEVGGLDQATAGEPLHVLVVGSDARTGLTESERQALSLGSFDGQRSDTVILVSISADRSEVSMVSFPRDLVVADSDGGIAKLTETYSEGRDALVRAVREDLGFPVNNFVEVSITGFIETVDVIGSVEVCLEEPLRDRDAGADLPAGCQELDPTDALAYVRSRDGLLGDFDRIERQQTFLRGMIAEVLDARLLLDPGRLVAVAEEVSSNVTVDESLDVPTMVTIAQQLQDALSGGIEMATVPAYPRTLDDDGATKAFVVPYEPGLRELVAEVRSDQPVAPRGTGQAREEVEVALWTGGRPGAAVVESTLVHGGFDVDVAGSGPLDAGPTTTVYELPGQEQQAAWVGAHLGAPVRSLPAELTAPDGATVVVAVGDDAEVGAPPA